MRPAMRHVIEVPPIDGHETKVRFLASGIVRLAVVSDFTFVVDFVFYAVLVTGATVT